MLSTVFLFPHQNPPHAPRQENSFSGLNYSILSLFILNERFMKDSELEDGPVIFGACSEREWLIIEESIERYVSSSTQGTQVYAN
mmetsp:Transcript_2510/g.3775  ORF Transcript_2510/g.3775 Transcript_2510/m.3775 type:complete len:85 (-) Transcript_2510:151-405(-)